MKIIFLDIDGVCNCATTRERICGIVGVEQEKIALVRQIVEATGAKIVLSSTWRLDMLARQEGKNPTNDTFDYLVAEFAKQGLEFYDYTPSHSDSWRGREIQQWLNEVAEPIEKYIVIDDDIWDIAVEHKGHVLCTSWQDGLKPNAVKWAIQMLNKE